MCLSGDIDGQWGDWSSSYACSVTCGGGTKLKTRICNRPTPLGNGKQCPGNDQLPQHCALQPCKLKFEKTISFNMNEILGFNCLRLFS